LATVTVAENRGQCYGGPMPNPVMVDFWREN